MERGKVGLELREIEAPDLGKLEELAKHWDFPVPDVDSKLYFAKSVVISGDKIIGFGLARVTSEFILLLNPKEPKRLQIKALELLFRVGVMSTIKVGIDEAHAFITPTCPSTYVDILKRKYGFVDCEGVPLYLKL